MRGRRAPSTATGTAGGSALLTVLGGFAAQVPLLVSGVLVARLLGVEDRGHLALLWVVSLALAFVGATGIPSAITYWVARDPSTSRPLARLVLRVAAVQALVATALHALVLGIALHDERSAVLVAAAISLPVVPSMIAVMHSMAFLQGFQRFRPWTALRLAPPVLYTLAVVVVAAAGGGLVLVTAMWVGSFVVTALLAVRSAAAALPASSAGAPAPSFGALQRFGGKAFLGAASPSDTLQLDQALVGLFVSPTALGLYVVALAFTNLPRLVAQSIGYVAFPHVAQKAERRQARRSMWRWGALAVLVAGAITCSLELAAGWLVPFFFGDEFTEAVPLTRILLAAAFLVSVRRVLADGARGAGQPGLGTVAEVASTLLLLPALAVTAGSFGVRGVAWTLVAAGALGLAVLLVGLARSAAPPAGERAGPAPTREAPADPALIGEGSR